MKKVIVLTMVLATTAFAAELNVAVRGPTEWSVGEAGQIRLVLVGDAAATETLDTANMLMKIETGGGDFEITGIHMNPALEDIGNMPTPATMSAADGYQIAFWGPYVPITADFVAFTFDVTSMGGGDITIGLYPHNVPQPQYNSAETCFESMSMGQAFDGMTTPLTAYLCAPEPASLSLLAIGGLAVLRRR